MANEEQGIVIETVTLGAVDSPGPQTSAEARQFLEGVRAGVARYAVAVGHSALRSVNEVLKQLLDEACDEAIGYFRRFGDDDEPPRDWRVGLSCKVKNSRHAYYFDSATYDPGEIVAVLPSGTAGITDKDGVLAIKLATGTTILAPANDWMTA